MKIIIDGFSRRCPDQPTIETHLSNLRTRLVGEVDRVGKFARSAFAGNREQADECLLQTACAKS